MGTSSERWREVQPGLFHLGDGPDAIVERHPARDEWHWRCPGAARIACPRSASTPPRAARAAMKEVGEARATIPPSREVGA